MAKAKLIRRPITEQVLPGGTHLHTLVQRLYLARGIKSYNEVDYQLKNLHQPIGFNGLNQAAQIIIECIKNRSHIVIVGDFDADGATSSALVIRALRQMGAEYVSFLVPNRFDYGYGLTTELVDELVKLKADLVITVDNGISSVDGVAKAKSLAMKVVITDHHLPPEQLPVADAIVNPNCEGDEFPSKALAGVGVAFYLISAVRSQLRQENWFENRQLAVPNFANLMDLVALGTVADLVPLDGNNRILVNSGLSQIKLRKCAIGISALFEVAEVDQKTADATSLAFYIAPRLNAAGRLEDMSIGINLLLTDDPREAKLLAEQLQKINHQRKEIQADMQTFADSVVNELKEKKHFPDAICLYHKNWHQGVVGLLASKVKEFTHRPVIAFAKENPESEWLKGSARSIHGLNIRDVLVEIDAANPELIKKFGGHAMAAGLSLKRNHLQKFQQQFNSWVTKNLTKNGLEKIVYSDGEVTVEDMSLHTAEMIQQAGPWGQHFEQPLFDDWFIVKQKRLIGDNHTKLILQTTDLQKQIAAIAFNRHPNDFVAEDHSIHVGYQMMVNEFRNRRSLQLKIEYVF